MKATTKVAAIIVAGLLILSGCAESAPAQQPTATPMPGVVMQGGDAAKTGVFGTKPLRKLNEADGGLNWKFRAEPDKSLLSISDTPIAANGFVYAVHSYSDLKRSGIPRLQELLLSMKVQLVALDAKTGQMKWSFPEEGLIRHQGQPPVYADGVVYFSMHTSAKSPSASVLYALNASDGKEIWRFERNDGEFGPPVVAGETLYFLSGEETPKLSVYALDRQTGKEKWKFQATGTYYGDSLIVIDGTVYFSTGWLGLPDNSQIDAAMYAVDANNGQEKWKRTPEEGPSELLGIRAPDGKEALQVYIASISSPQAPLQEIIIGNGIAYLLGEEALYAFDTKIGKEKWKLSLKYGDPTPPIIAGDVLYFGTVQRERDAVVSDEAIFVYAVNTSTGQEIWKYKVEDSGNRISELAIADGMIYFTAGDGSYLYALHGE